MSTAASATGEIVALARRMLQAARAGDWDAVIAAEAERRGRIAACFATPTPPGDAAAVAEAIEVLLAIDREVVQLARRRMGELGTELDAVGQGRRARQAYAALS